MNTITDIRLSRRRYTDGLTVGSTMAAWAEGWLKLLITQDGSATLLCEMIAHGPVQLTVHHQHATEQVPLEVKSNLPGRRFLERFVSLSSNGEVMMDNLSYIALDAIESDVRQILEEGRLPIGHLFEQMWVKKKPLSGMDALHARLWDRCGLPDPKAVRSYIVDTPYAKTMLITETFRYGMRLGMPTHAG